MRAVGYYQPLPITAPESLLDLDLPEPRLGERDLLLEIRAIAVNPVDVKVRAKRPSANGVPVVPGWDAVGIVRAAGAAAPGFAVGDRVWWAGELTRPGCYAELQAVDHRIVARAPTSWSDAAAAALPLTGITAWELLFDRLRVQDDAPRPIGLVVTAASGGVGSILLQLARALPHVTVVATMSRPDDRAAEAERLRSLGAHHVLDHARPLAPQVAALGAPPIRHVASLSHTPEHFADLIALLEPQGRLALIDDFGAGAIDVMALKGKAISLHWEMMFTRSLHQTHDMAAQGALLGELAARADAGALRTTLGEELGPINAANLKRAHAQLETQHTQGKLVLRGF